MSNNCSFGRPSDLGFKSLCQDGRVVIDKDLNVCVQKMLPKNAADGVLVENGVFQNKAGIGRLSLDDNVFLFDGDSELLDGSYWNTDFETFGQPLAGQGDSMLTIPSTYHPCVPSFSMLLEIDVTLKMYVGNFQENDNIELALIKNSDTSGDVISFSCLAVNYVNTTQTSLHLHDVVLCSPGDTLDLEFRNNSDSGKIEIIDNYEFSHVNYKVLSLQPPILDI